MAYVDAQSFAGVDAHGPSRASTRTVGVHEMAKCDTMSMVTCGEHVVTSKSC